MTTSMKHQSGVRLSVCLSVCLTRFFLLTLTPCGVVDWFFLGAYIQIHSPGGTTDGQAYTLRPGVRRFLLD